MLPLLEQLLQLLKVSHKALDILLIPGASQAFALQRLTEDLEFSLKLQIWCSRMSCDGALSGAD